MPASSKDKMHKCNLVLALKCEAKPLINHFGLVRDNSQSLWPLYYNDALSLIISGVGKINAAAACSWLQSQQPAQCWVNIGIAGHADADIGSLWLVNTVTDKETHECWQTGRLPNHADMASMPLLTVNTASDYEYEDMLYDMEAAGVASACTQFTDEVSIAVIKIVSDNKDQHWQKINAKAVSSLLHDSIPLIESLIDSLTSNDPAPTL